MDFNIEINASREKVWDVLFGEKTYPIWTTAFSEGSKVETDWKKGSKALFLDSSNRGMVSRIADNVPNEYMSIEHLGMYDNGVEDYESEQVKMWAGAKENYTLTDLGGKTNLHIFMEMDESEQNKQMIDMFAEMWPKALAKVKELAESTEEIIPPVVV
ncbi:SRPBCC domain-containing protein [Pedobacter insulae]|uniref:Activator of Hsp90 ATPase homolog 1-like protein n=1 Tax=Pedobacter insulae TaxID=414048 RepID=A0A1I2Y0H0_9SPHI|nr:SRPBCC domain-containing protein [Pedobacter insulae]SFH19132.1 Activator of Hsp90 ATPase homolog 1-like protein [Pedobacter insulae]